jgi:hypothetical protein
MKTPFPRSLGVAISLWAASACLPAAPESASQSVAAVSASSVPAVPLAVPAVRMADFAPLGPAYTLVNDAQAAAGCFHLEDPTLLEVTLPDGGFSSPSANAPATPVFVSVNFGGSRNELLYAGDGHYTPVVAVYSQEPNGDVGLSMVPPPDGGPVYECPLQIPGAVNEACGLAQLQTTYLSQIVGFADQDAADPSLWHTAILANAFALPPPASLQPAPANRTVFTAALPPPDPAHPGLPLPDSYGVWLNAHALLARPLGDAPWSSKSAACSANVHHVIWGSDNGPAINNILQLPRANPEVPITFNFPGGRYLVLAREVPTGTTQSNHLTVGEVIAGNAAVQIPSHTRLLGEVVNGAQWTDLTFVGVLGVPIAVPWGDQEHQGRKACLNVPAGNGDIVVGSFTFEGENQSPYLAAAMVQAPFANVFGALNEVVDGGRTTVVSDNVSFEGNRFRNYVGYAVEDPSLLSSRVSATGNEFVHVTKGLNVLANHSDQSDNLFYETGMEALGGFSTYDRNVFVGGGGLWVGGAGYGAWRDYVSAAEAPAMEVVGNTVYQSAASGMYVNSGTVDGFFAGNLIDDPAWYGIEIGEGLQSTLFDIFANNQVNTLSGYPAPLLLSNSSFEPLFIGNVFDQYPPTGATPWQLLANNLTSGIFTGNTFSGVNRGVELAFSQPGDTWLPNSSPPLASPNVIKFHCNSFDAPHYAQTPPSSVPPPSARPTATIDVVPGYDGGALPALQYDSAYCLSGSTALVEAEGVFPDVPAHSFQVLQLIQPPTGFVPGDAIEARFAPGSSVTLQGANGRTLAYVPAPGFQGRQDPQLLVFAVVPSTDGLRVVLFNQGPQLLLEGSAQFELQVASIAAGQRELVRALYHRFFGTDPSPDEMGSILTAALTLRGPLPLAVESLVFSSSSYWNSRDATPEGFVLGLFRDGLHQRTDEAAWLSGHATWLSFWEGYDATDALGSAAWQAAVTHDFIYSQLAFYQWDGTSPPGPLVASELAKLP